MCASQNSIDVSPTILVITPDGTRHDNIGPALQAAGYVVRIARGWPEGEEAAQRLLPDLVIACGSPTARQWHSLRQRTFAPILALLAVPTPSGIVEALDGGADDCQPASLRQSELLMRTRCLLRRGP